MKIQPIRLTFKTEMNTLLLMIFKRSVPPLKVQETKTGHKSVIKHPYESNTLIHWSQTQLLEGHSSAQFSSNPNQTHLSQLIKLFKITRNFQAGVIWSWLELNSAELWPSRNGVWDLCKSCEKIKSLYMINRFNLGIYTHKTPIIIFLTDFNKHVC